MPLIIYLYCGLISFSSLYGCYYLKANLRYISGAFAFILFAWAICVDYYLGYGIFTIKLSLVVGLICAGFWHIIESRHMVRAFSNHYQNDLLDNETSDEGNHSILLELNMLHVTYIIGAIFYSPLLYMGFRVLRDI